MSRFSERAKELFPDPKQRADAIELAHSLVDEALASAAETADKGLMARGYLVMAAIVVYGVPVAIVLWRLAVG